MKSVLRKRTFTKCNKCGRINFVLNHYLKSLRHPYFCRHCSNHWKPTTFLERINSSLAHRKHSLDEFFFSEVNNEEKAYWLGFLAADGNVIGNKVRLQLAHKDKEHLKLFKTAMKWTGKNRISKKDNSIEVAFRSLRMATDLEKYFITPRKTFTVKFPSLPKSLEKHFIRGVFDADGCITKATRTRKGKSGQKYICYGGEFCIEGNREFISVLQNKIMEIGLPLNSINYSGKSIFRVRYGGINQLKIIYDYLYEDSNIFLDRKKKLFEEIIKNYHCEKV